LTPDGDREMGGPMRDGPNNEVIIMRNIAGSAWLEAGRTGVCPTPDWLREH
jgi:hypothetical protein